MGRHTAAQLAVHLKQVGDRFELTDCRLHGITTDNASSNHLMTWELQSTLENSGIVWPALRNHIPPITHVIQLALGSFMSSLGVKGHSKSWEAHERNQQFGENKCIHMGKSQRLQNEGNAIVNKVSAMRPGLAEIIETVCIWTYCESSQTNLHMAENACCIDYDEAWSSTQVHWLPHSQGPVAVLLIMNVQTLCNSTLKLHKHAHQLREFTHVWLMNPTFSHYRPLFTTHDEWTIIKYVMGVSKPFRYWTLWMSKRHTLSLHYIITVYNDMFDHLDGIMRDLA